MSGHRWWPTISPCSPRSFSPEATKIVERPARRTGECLLMSTLAAATRFASGRLKKSAHPIVAADKARRTNPCKHSIRYRARQKISVYGQTLASFAYVAKGGVDVSSFCVAIWLVGLRRRLARFLIEHDLRANA